MAARLLIEYDGTPFAGWAAQPGRRTVQSELEAALATVLRRATPLTVAGRTDRGVHARGQVAGHMGPPAKASSLNALLPPEIAVLASDPAPDEFDARRDARSRTYRYAVCTRPARAALERDRVLHWRHALDPRVLDACAAAVTGRHDFTAFTPTQGGHRHFERTVVRSEWLRPAPDRLEYWVEADSFLRRMVRTLVGTMLAAASGRFDPEAFEGLLSGRSRDEAGDPAPAHGLYLELVSY